jgi:hypothetical protein
LAFVDGNACLLQRNLTQEELLKTSSEELKAMLQSREAWHALAEARTAAASGLEAERDVLLKHTLALQAWPSVDSPVIGIFCGDDMVPRFHENNVRFLLHTLQHTEPEWKQAVYGFFEEVLKSSNELFDHYKISNEDHSLKKLTRTLEKKFRARVWWYVHREEEKKRAAAAAAAATEVIAECTGDASVVSTVPPFMFSSFDTVPPGVLLHTNGCTWTPTTGHWVTYDWGSRGAACCGLREIVVSASSLQDHTMSAVVDSFHELLGCLKQTSPPSRLPPSHTPRPLPSSSDLSLGMVS